MVTMLRVTVQVAHLSVIASFLLQVVANLIVDVIEITIQPADGTLTLICESIFKNKRLKVNAICYRKSDFNVENTSDGICDSLSP